MRKDFDGYPAEVDYTIGYSSCLSPTLLRLAATHASVAFPTGRPLRYLELGYGNGVSLNIHAAATPGEYWGTDVNPSHAEFATMLGRASGSGVHVLDQSFAALLARSDLPDFDVIVLHGVWSWISDANRGAIVELLRTKLVEGGVCYVSYNAMPGSSGVVPLQELLALHAERGDRDETILERLAGAIAFASQLRDAGAKYFTSMPSAADRLEDMKRRNPVYLVHEYLVHWKPTSFSSIASHLATAGMRFVASANLMQHFAALHITPAGASLLASIADPLLRETAFDVLRNQEFRDDIFIKGGEPVTQSERDRALRDTAFTLVVPVAALPTSVKSGNGEISLSHAPLDEILPALAADGYRAKSASEIARLCSRHTGSIDEVLNALLLLVGCRLAHPVQEPVVIERAWTGCERLNRTIHDLSRGARRVSAVASPVTGSGVTMSREQQLCLLAYQAGARSPDALALDACSMLADADDAGRRRLTIMKAALLFHESLPMYAALGVLPQ